MNSPYCEKAIIDAVRHGKAILKFISPNDVGRTGSHQYGYYLPKAIWEAYTPYPPEKNKNNAHLVKILWQDGRETKSCIKWYGKGTRSEYRLTRFGRDFPYRTTDNVGDLLIIIPTSSNSFLGYVLDLEEDIESIEAALGIELTGAWALYDASIPPSPESEDDCIDRLFRDFCKNIEQFPPTAVFSEKTRFALLNCIKTFKDRTPDHQLLDFMSAEYKLFRLAERCLCQRDINRLFESVEDFLSTAARIMNRRKSRAGRSLENHVEFILRSYEIPFEMRPDVDGKPDIIIPSRTQYKNPKFPLSKLFMVGIKTTCKDRWRQVLNEAKRIPHKHILTIQQGISVNQLREMHKSNVSLIVPKPIHKQYPTGTSIQITTLDSFIQKIKRVLS